MIKDSSVDRAILHQVCDLEDGSVEQTETPILTLMSLFQPSGYFVLCWKSNVPFIFICWNIWFVWVWILPFRLWVCGRWLYMIDGQHAATVSMILSIAESAKTSHDVTSHDHIIYTPQPCRTTSYNSTSTLEFLAGKKSFSSTSFTLSCWSAWHSKPNLTAYHNTTARYESAKRVHCLCRGLL